MLFNSLDFAVFLPLAFFSYWFVFQRNLKWQNFLLLTASYLFYGWWDWRFLSIIFISSLVDYVVGIAIDKNSERRNRKLFLFISVVVNIGFLIVFKYFNFFIESFATSFHFLGLPFQLRSLNIILPVGISFYTFQTLSYTIDIYKGRIEPTKDVIAFFAFVSFFPQLVAGPIERASNLIPQFVKPRAFDYDQATDGLRQILWGLFKKVVIADNCAIYVDKIFANHTSYTGSALMIGAILFAFQIYCDFSGYSDIAIGTARLFGFDLMRNFSYPYFSRDIAEFWRRWHISLSSWFRDYIYIPLGGSRGNSWLKVRNCFIIFLLSGFWHGANWTFIVWGALNAIFLFPLMLTSKNRRNLSTISEGKIFPNFRDILKILVTFTLTVTAWIFFRSETLSHAISFLVRMYSISLFTSPQLLIGLREVYEITIIIISLIILISIEWINRNKQHGLHICTRHISFSQRWGLYSFISLIILVWGQFNKTEFIYFAF